MRIKMSKLIQSANETSKDLDVSQDFVVVF